MLHEVDAIVRRKRSWASASCQIGHAHPSCPLGTRASYGSPARVEPWLRIGLQLAVNVQGPHAT